MSLCKHSDFFQHFGNGTSTGSVGKNSLILPSVGKIGDIYLKTSKIMISVIVICFQKINNILLGSMKISVIPCHRYQIN